MGYIVGLLISLYVYRKPTLNMKRKISDSDNVTELKYLNSNNCSNTSYIFGTKRLQIQ